MSSVGHRAIAATPPNFALLTQPLTREQVASLPDGADVLILWSGGSGPHHYRVKRDDEHGGVFAAIPSPRGRDAWWTRPVEMTAAEPPLTVVWRLVEAPWPADLTAVYREHVAVPTVLVPRRLLPNGSAVREIMDRMWRHYSRFEIIADGGRDVRVEFRPTLNPTYGGNDGREVARPPMGWR